MIRSYDTKIFRKLSATKKRIIEFTSSVPGNNYFIQGFYLTGIVKSRFARHIHIADSNDYPDQMLSLKVTEVM